MIREDKFLISRRPYAVDLDTVTGRQVGGIDRVSFSGACNAVWFRRRRGVTVACLGTLKLWSHYLSEPLNLDDPTAILSADLDGRYGGDTEGRWDGESYWGNVTLEQQEQHLAVLRPMLAAYPALPDGYDGWWRF
ncbi:hypothetical protein ACWDHW_08500 [Streptomyces melanosporofaciens]